MRDGASRMSRALRDGWGVDDHEVVLAGGVEIVQLLHRQVVVAVHEAAGDVLVQRVVEHRVREPRRRARGGGSGRPTPPWCRASPPTALPRGVMPESAKALSGTRTGSLPNAGDAERGSQTTGGVDGEHEHPARLLGGGLDGESGRHRGLAHPARSGDEDHLLAGQQGVERARPSCAAMGASAGARHQCPVSSSSARAVATSVTTRRPVALVNSSGT